ncbi:hypothetical protein WMF30_10555 [Sorangium sp. So ce134]
MERHGAAEEAVMDQVGDIMVWLESPSGYVVRFHFLASAGQATILGERCPEVMVETSRGGYAVTTTEHACDVIARASRLWRKLGQTPAEPEWTLYRCAGPSCPGLPYRASDIAHPASCALPAPELANSSAA